MTPETLLLRIAGHAGKEERRKDSEVRAYTSQIRGSEIPSEAPKRILLRAAVQKSATVAAE
jgi:hypothetical protein